MNGIDAVALATGQDTRAVEASIHAYAGIGSRYQPVTQYAIERKQTSNSSSSEDAYLVGSIEVPLSVGTKGGSASTHPVFRYISDSHFLLVDRPFNLHSHCRMAILCIYFSPHHYHLHFLYGLNPLHSHRWALELMGEPDSATLAEIMVSVGLAQNMAALRALAIEGIQRGHMALHVRKEQVLQSASDVPATSTTITATTAASGTTSAAGST